MPGPLGRSIVLSGLLLGLAAAAGGAQETVLLRLAPPLGQQTRYRVDLDTWLTTPLLQSNDPNRPTVRIVSHITRTVTSVDSGRIEYTDVTDSSRYDFPALRALYPALGQNADLLRGMRTVTRMDARGRSVTTQVLVAPNLPPELPALIRGIQGLVVTATRLATVSLPEQAVETGDVWSDSLRYDLGTTQGLEQSIVQGGGVGLADMRLDRLDRRAGAGTATFSARASVTAGAGDAAASATMTVNATASSVMDLGASRVTRAEMDMDGPMLTRLGVIPVRLHLVMTAR